MIQYQQPTLLITFSILRTKNTAITVEYQLLMVRDVG